MGIELGGDRKATRAFKIPSDSFQDEMAVSCFNVLSQESTAKADPREQPDMRLNLIRR